MQRGRECTRSLYTEARKEGARSSESKRKAYGLALVNGQIKKAEQQLDENVARAEQGRYKTFLDRNRGKARQRLLEKHIDGWKVSTRRKVHILERRCAQGVLRHREEGPDRIQADPPDGRSGSQPCSRACTTRGVESGRSRSCARSCS